MKHLVVTPTFPFSTHTFVTREVASTVKAGAEVVVLAPTSGDTNGQLFADELGVPRDSVIYLDYAKCPPIGFHLSRFASSVRKAARRVHYGRLLSERRKTYFARLLALKKLQGVDLIHAHFTGWAYDVAYPLSQLLECPFTVTAHDSHLARWPNERLCELQEKAARITFVSTAWQRLWAGKTGSQEKLIVVPNGIQLADFPAQPPILDNSIVRIISVSRLVPHKRITDALEAVSILCKRGVNCHYDVVGEGPELEKLMDQATRLGIRKRVTFHGAMSNKGVRACLLSANLLVHPSERESFGVVVAEGMAAFLPVVAARSGGVEDIVDHGENGILYEPGNVEQLVEHLYRLATDPRLREEFSKAGREKVERRFSWESHMDSMFAVWNDAVAGIHRKAGSPTTSARE